MPKIKKKYTKYKDNMKNIKPSYLSAENRTWLIPYMGDASFAAAATLRHFDIDAQVLPTNTKRGFELAQKHIQSEACYPLKGVTGDTLDFLKTENEKNGERFVDNKYFILMPTTTGPCRFGKYQETLRQFMDEEGFKEVPVGGPTTATDYSDILNQFYSDKDKLKLQQILMKGVTATDLLDDITLRTRPYATDKQEVNQLKKQRLNELEILLQEGAETQKLVEWGTETVNQFKTHLSTNERFPLIVYAGEIYMRQHDPYTGNVIEKLEAQKLEAVRTPVMEWIEYTNKVNRIDSKSKIGSGIKQLNPKKIIENSKKLLTQTIKGAYIHNVHQKIAKPFHEILEGRHSLPEPLEIIKTLEKNNEFSGHIRGESALSIGIGYYLMNNLIPESKNPISGMFHVGPFTCMQEGVATAKIEAMSKELRKTKPDLLFPVIHGTFGDSANPNLDSEIAVFREQCYQKNKMLNN